CCPPPPCSLLFPYTTLFRSAHGLRVVGGVQPSPVVRSVRRRQEPDLGHQLRPQPSSYAREELLERSPRQPVESFAGRPAQGAGRSEEHTSELQSRVDLVCRL